MTAPVTPDATIARSSSAAAYAASSIATNGLSLAGLLELLEANAVVEDLAKWLTTHPKLSALVLALAVQVEPPSPPGCTEPGDDVTCGNDLTVLAAVNRIGRASVELFLLDELQTSADPALLDRFRAQRQRLLVGLISQERAVTRELQETERTLQATSSRIREVEQQLIHDDLTGAYNRAFALETLTNEAERCRRYQRPLAVIFVDVDHFKRINDCCGHLFGDKVLRQIARSMCDTLRGADVLARYGGEEFLIIPNEPSVDGITRLADRLRTAVEERTFEFNGRTWPITISLGAAQLTPGFHETDPVSRLLSEADAAMYQAKHRGRNCALFRDLD